MKQPPWKKKRHGIIKIKTTFLVHISMAAIFDTKMEMVNIKKTENFKFKCKGE